MEDTLLNYEYSVPLMVFGIFFNEMIYKYFHTTYVYERPDSINFNSTTIDNKMDRSKGVNGSFMNWYFEITIKEKDQENNCIFNIDCSDCSRTFLLPKRTNK